MKEKIENYLKSLEGERAVLVDQRAKANERIAEIGQEIVAMRRFAQACRASDMEEVRERGEDMNRVCPELVDSRDAAKINIFTEVIEKLGDDLSSTNIRKNMSRLNHYIYNRKARLWTSTQDFRDDYRAWIDCSGHWGNLPRRSEGVRGELRIAR